MMCHEARRAEEPEPCAQLDLLALFGKRAEDFDFFLRLLKVLQVSAASVKSMWELLLEKKGVLSQDQIATAVDVVCASSPHIDCGAQLALWATQGATQPEVTRWCTTLCGAMAKPADLLEEGQL